MPRVDGVSMSSTVWWGCRNPRPCTTAACFLSKPMVLLTSVTLTRLVSADFFDAFFAIRASCVLARGPYQIGQVLAAKPRDRGRIFQRHQSIERGAYHVVRVGGSKRLGQHVL